MTSAADSFSACRGTRWCLYFLLVVALIACGEEKTPQQYSINGNIFGTTYSVQIISKEQLDSDALKDKIATRLEAINDVMSTWKQDSELSLFNSHLSGDWYPVSSELGSLLRRSLLINDITQGAFDPTVGPLIQLWGFADNRQLRKLPDSVAIEVAKSRTGMGSLEIDTDNTRIRKSQNIRIDLSAIAKGYAVDEVVKILEQAGLADFLVEIGGELYLKGDKNGQAWTVGIENPDPAKRELHIAIQVSDTAVATSGNYRNFFEIDGKRYSHIIDPRTGYPVDHDLLSVTVLASDSATADAYATAFMVLGTEQSKAIAEQQGLAVYMLAGTTDDFKAFYTESFSSFLP